ncbi:septum formation initiator family protein [Anaerospora sp.]|uniref:FtsB family cell division protein n=1 Tax=Anaerospora sp. TaxID=1960278 RepID=UPI0028A1EF89|nr:septum formation initiator family protein [Anaerospora sp.]
MVKRKYRLNWFRVVMIAIILYTVYVCVNQQLQYAAISREIEATKTQLEQLQQTNEAMGQEKQKLSTPAHVEKLAREELGLVKPGEIPYVR